ncbi:hypothetical protein [Streptomyces longispororuber]|uniref:hypothetical protein n=1 Tax=Streptomyces longispororuber TaxID=68230 RepID=UPI0036FF36C5
MSLFLVAAWLMEITPFENSARSGDIETANICESLGNHAEAAKNLRSILPEAAAYSFEETPGTRTDASKGTYTSACFARSEKKILVSARTEMMRAESPRGWATAEVFDGQGNVDEYQSFPAGDKGLASPMQAAVFVPCLPEGKVPGGRYNLSVIVQLKQAADSDEDKARKALIGLTVRAAKFAHQDAGCGLPSHLPGQP